jgi:DNA-binding transcriptional regulator LsrR (DeoR family)
VRTRRRHKPDGLSDSPHLIEALQVAYYHCVLQMPLKNIAELLGKSPATVTRRLDEVRQAGWLRDRPEFTPPPEIWEELKSRMTCADIESALQDYFGQELLQQITVLPSVVGADNAENRPAQLESVERVGLYAARRLSEALCEGEHVVGINWGWSVRQCVVNLRPPRPNPHLRFLPIVGNLSLDETDPHFEEAIECSSNRLAQLAAAAFDAPRAPRLNTPAYIPRRFHQDSTHLRAIRDFIENDVSYRRIFGGVDESGSRQSGLIECVDTLITGLTSLDVQTLPIYRPNLITPEDLPVLQRAGVVGDLALHLVVASDDPDTPDSSPPSPERELVAHVNNLIVGATPQDFICVAERVRHGTSDGLGVIVLAVGAWKAPILTTAIRMRAVNELITDLETALAICSHVHLALPEKHQQTASARA